MRNSKIIRYIAVSAPRVAKLRPEKEVFAGSGKTGEETYILLFMALFQARQLTL
jgi:hypothetical protein